MAAPATEPAIAPAALPDVVFPTTDDGDSVERGASETATVCLVTVTVELLGTVCVTPESALLAGEGEGAGGGNEDEDEDEDEDEEIASGDAIVLVRVLAVELVIGLGVQSHSHHHPDSSERYGLKPHLSM
ncbi:hypothetical protein E4U17_004015 [Claviceps sp. LM77 group G4]|nr:hypothetical protein E4U17_004015 [Claviceps sp. LM77 group G4]KAG6081216.1 hypothetical protein E4U16_007672 [Claviceps sp. LM84 group G4]